MAKPYLSVIIPNYPKTDQLLLTLIDVDKHLSRQEYSYEIILVNSRTVQKMGDFIPNLKFIESDNNKSYGAMVCQGMLAARGNWRLLMGADNATSVAEFNKITPYLSGDYEILVGSSGPKFYPLLRRNFICFAELAAMEIFPLTKITHWGFIYEVLEIAKTLKYKIKKIAITYGERERRFLGILNYLRIFLNIMKVHWWLWRKSYPIYKDNGQHL